MKDIYIAIKMFFKIIALSLILVFAVGWISNITHCEYLTFRYGYQFEELYKENLMLGNLVRFKVLAYYDDYAEIYYVTENKEIGIESGNVLSFRKENEKWKYDNWLETIWSNQGSADGYIWPYGR